MTIWRFPCPIRHSLLIHLQSCYFTPPSYSFSFSFPLQLLRSIVLFSQISFFFLLHNIFNNVRIRIFLIPLVSGCLFWMLTASHNCLRPSIEMSTLNSLKYFLISLWNKRGSISSVQKCDWEHLQPASQYRVHVDYVIDFCELLDGPVQYMKVGGMLILQRIHGC